MHLWVQGFFYLLVLVINFFYIRSAHILRIKTFESNSYTSDWILLFCAIVSSCWLLIDWLLSSLTVDWRLIVSCILCLSILLSGCFLCCDWFQFRYLPVLLYLGLLVCALCSFVCCCVICRFTSSTSSPLPASLVARISSFRSPSLPSCAGMPVSDQN